MKYIKFIDKIRHLNDQVHHESIHLVENNIHLDTFTEVTEQDRDIVFKDLADSFKLNLSPTLKEIMIPLTIHLCWHYELDGVKETGGEFNLKRTPSLFSNTAISAFKDALNPFEKELYMEGYRFFDGHPHAGDTQVFSILLQDDKIAPNVYCIDLKSKELSSMEIDYFQYLDHALFLKGLYGWQYLFQDIDFREFEFETSNIGRRIRDYPKLFSESDVSEYLKRYKDRGGE
ncbi:hypothetical protein [Aquimarina agarivorans]|uniref:hypothetical protein n=1 Tax=Aquimarina agarivorans TaxID=980584 RepID=UPI000248F2C5|nr:hypothetical protein [Aquimarina agarivorans]